MSLAKLKYMVSAPFTAGTSHSQDGGSMQDGSISTIVLGASIQTFAVISLVLMYVTHPMSAMEMSLVLWCFISLTQFVGLTSTIILAFFVYRRRVDWGTQTDHRFGGRKMIFLWIFGLSGVLQFSFIASVNIYCIHTVATIDNHSVRIEGLSFASNIISILFYVMQLGFISFFHKIKFQSSKIVNYTMMLILTATILEYINAILSDGLLDHIASNSSWEITHNKTDACYWTSPLRTFFLNIYPYIVPAKIEFSLLSSACLLKMWSNCKPWSNVAHPLTSFVSHSTQPESMPLLAPNFMPNYESTSSQVTNSSTRSSFSRHISLYVTLVVGALISTPMIVVVCLALYVTPSSSDYINVWEEMRLFTEIMLFVVIMMTFYHAGEAADGSADTNGLDSDEVILLLSTCGTIGINCFGMYLGFMDVAVESRQRTVDYVVGESALASINAYLQTVLIIHGNRLRPSTVQSTSCFRVENLFMLLHIFNICMWLLLTLTSNQLKLLTPIQQKFFGTEQWKLIAHVFVPLFLYFRFQSALDLYSLYCKFRT